MPPKAPLPGAAGYLPKPAATPGGIRRMSLSKCPTDRSGTRLRPRSEYALPPRRGLAVANVVTRMLQAGVDRR